jgi:flagellar hook-associated protein 1 FlgK
VSLNGILSTALSALQTNTTALGVVSQNISNLNTRAMRIARSTNRRRFWAEISGVDIADIQRVTNQFLTQETLNANSSSSNTRRSPASSRS